MKSLVSTKIVKNWGNHLFMCRLLTNITVHDLKFRPIELNIYQIVKPAVSSRMLQHLDEEYKFSTFSGH